MTFTTAELQYLQAQALGRLATARPDGSLQNNPVGFHWDEHGEVIRIHPSRIISWGLDPAHPGMSGRAVDPGERG
ncbi:MAG: hypothetical protein ACR2GF_05980 [Acidimicrobiales bacterium]